MRYILLVVIVFALVACGGGRDRSSGGSSARIAYAEGPISQACLRAGRKSASRSLCGCIQAVANKDLSTRDQTRAAGFFAEPQRAQDTRQSDNFSSEAFWKRYKAYAANAERTCRGA